jgi:hypothetical protein
MGNVDGDYDEFSAGEVVDLSCSFSILRGGVLQLKLQAQSLDL